VYLLLKVFLDILRLRSGPQALPASGLLLGMVLGLHFLLGVVLLSFTLAFGGALIAALAGSLLVPLLVHTALRVRGLGHRFLQTTTAMAGAEFLLALATLPFSAGPATGGIAAVIALLVVGWSFAVAAHIFRQALSISAWSGFIVAFLYMLISYVVAGLFVGPGA
jgi:hypothetical protein